MSGLSFSLGTGSKRPPAKPVGIKDLFGADEEDVVDDQGPDAKKQRPAVPGSADSPSEIGEAMKNAEKLAEYVAKNGRSFEDLTRERNPGNTPFKFLHDKTSALYRYYSQKLLEHEAKLGKAPANQPVQLTAQQPAAAPASQTSLPSAPPHEAAKPSKRASRWDAPSMPPPASAAPSAPAPVPTFGAAQAQDVEFEKLQAQRAMQKGDTVAAMDAYMKMMAKKEKEREAREEEEEERRKRSVPLLNETSFDRRKVTAVFKEDGTRGHHMSDFIPAEELAKLLAKGGDALAKAQAAALEKRNQIQADNIGHKLLSKMGWKEGEGIGASKDGITAPVSASSSSMRPGDNLGLGAEVHGEVKEGDDAFEQYRKRMMLGYKHRPNPLGNPRKAYY